MRLRGYPNHGHGGNAWRGWKKEPRWERKAPDLFEGDMRRMGYGSGWGFGKATARESMGYTSRPLNPRSMSGAFPGATTT